MPRIIAKCLICLTPLLLPILAVSGTISVNANSGNLSASAEFKSVNNNLVVTLTNTSTADVMVPADVLTALFFDIDNVSLKTVSAYLAGGSNVLFGPSNGGNIGGEWAYEAGLSHAPGSATKGISSSGFDLFGKFNFNGINLQGNNNGTLAGLEYGITSAGDKAATGNKAVTGKQALIQNSLIFILSGLPNNFDPRNIRNVSFQYGTSLNEPNIHGTRVTSVPDGGATAILLGLTIAGICTLRGFAKRKEVPLTSTIGAMGSYISHGPHEEPVQRRD